MKIRNRLSETDEEDFIECVRECKCTFFCCGRPEMVVYDKNRDGNRVKIGRIVNPWMCCDLALDIFDGDEVLKYKISGSCCQLGIFCKCPCDSCETILFDVRSPSGEILSKLVKTSPGCAKAMMGDADNFSLDFPSGASVKDKALLMSAVIFLDYAYFENKPNQNNRRR